MIIISAATAIVGLLLGLLGKRFLDFCFCVLIFITTLILCFMFLDNNILSFIFAIAATIITYIIRGLFEFLLCLSAGAGISLSISLPITMAYELDEVVFIVILIALTILLTFIAFKIRKIIIVFVTSSMGATALGSAFILLRLDSQVGELLNGEQMDKFMQVLVGDSIVSSAIVFISFIVFLIKQLIYLTRQGTANE